MDETQKAQRKKPYKRKLTEQRRIQNRVAQRTYRARRKERLEYLERAVASTQRNIEDVDLEVPTLSSDSYSNNSDLGSPEESSERAGVPPFTTFRIRVSDEARNCHNIDTTLTPAQSTTTQSSSTANLKRILDLEDDEDVDALMEYAVVYQPDLKSIVLAGLRALRSEQPGAKNGEVNTASNATSQLVASRNQHSNSPPTTRPPAIGLVLPNSFANGIFLRPETLHEVYYQNARALGLSFEDIPKPHTQSPWHPIPFVPSILLAKSVPPDLYPTPAQVRYPHHPFIDLIPFPWLRERAIVLGYVDPPMFDRFDLKHDILSGGLVCWKSRARNEGQSWDRRSWEVEPWFFKKWAWLIEDQGKVEMQSRWWRGLRGD